MENNTNQFYNYTISNEVDEILKQASSLNTTIKKEKEGNESLWGIIAKKLKVDWTYNSNGIEGSTLTFGETLFFLNEGLTVEGKPFKDFLDARNHAETIDYLYDIIADKRDVSESIIKEINALLLGDMGYTLALNSLGEKVKKKLNAGEYKQQANHVLQPDGTIHWYVEPLKVKDEMQALIEWIEQNLDSLHPIIIAAITHYNLVRIHAFDDGNGRGARIIMNLILMKQGFYPVVIKVEKKRHYLNALAEADKGDLTPFIQFINDELISTYNRIINDLL